jgi:hypothetical protein
MPWSSKQCALSEEAAHSRAVAEYSTKSNADTSGRTGRCHQNNRSIIAARPLVGGRSGCAGT